MVDVPLWVYELLREYARKSARRAKGDEPTEDEILVTFKAVVSGSTIRLLATEKVGMILVFRDLETYPSDDPRHRQLIGDPTAFIAERFGGGKFKVNFYEGENFAATRNFVTEGEPLWKAWLAAREVGESPGPPER